MVSGVTSPRRGHQRNRGQHRHGGLADADHVAIAVDALQVADELLHVADVVVQVEFALLQRHHAGVLPVGDVDLVVLEHGADGVAQQRGVVARQRRDDQHRRLALEAGQRGRVIGEALEAAQFAERLVDFDALVDRHVGAVDVHGVDAELGLFVVLPQPVHQVVAGRHALGERVLAERATADCCRAWKPPARSRQTVPSCFAGFRRSGTAWWSPWVVAVQYITWTLEM